MLLSLRRLKSFQCPKNPTCEIFSNQQTWYLLEPREELGAGLNGHALALLLGRIVVLLPRLQKKLSFEFFQIQFRHNSFTAPVFPAKICRVLSTLEPYLEALLANDIVIVKLLEYRVQQLVRMLQPVEKRSG